jgi:hypothetical protein
MTDENIYNAVALWFEDNNQAAGDFGYISGWDTSQVTSMAWLFCSNGCFFQNPVAPTFDEDISGWDTSAATSMLASELSCGYPCIWGNLYSLNLSVFYLF